MALPSGCSTQGSAAAVRTCRSRATTTEHLAVKGFVVPRPLPAPVTHQPFLCRGDVVERDIHLLNQKAARVHRAGFRDLRVRGRHTVVVSQPTHITAIPLPPPLVLHADSQYRRKPVASSFVPALIRGWGIVDPLPKSGHRDSEEYRHEQCAMPLSRLTSEIPSEAECSTVRTQQTHFPDIRHPGGPQGVNTQDHPAVTHLVPNNPRTRHLLTTHTFHPAGTAARPPCAQGVMNRQRRNRKAE